MRFDPGVRWWAEHNLRAASFREAPGGRLDVELPVANVDALISWAIDFGDGVEILSPPSIRQRIVDHLRPHLQGDPR